MGTKLTAVSVKNAKPKPTGRREIPGGASGLYLVVQTTGSKSWAFRYRYEGKPVKLTLGPTLILEPDEQEPIGDPQIGKPHTLTSARQLAASLTRQVTRGENPVEATKAAKRERVRAGEDPDLFERVAEDFIQRYAKTSNRESSWRETARLLGFRPNPADPSKLVRRQPSKDAFSGVANQWAGRRVQDIRRRDVVELLDLIADGGAPYSANRAFAAVRRLFNWCVERDRLTASPCAGVRPPTTEISRDRVLSDAELKLVLRACETIGEPFGPFVKMLVLTGQRRDEVAGMLWSEVDLDEGRWTLPRERVKNDTVHEVPLSSAALDVLEGLTKIEGAPPFVFTSGRASKRSAEGSEPAKAALTAISGFSKAKLKLDAAMLAIARKDAEEMGADGGEVRAIPDWRFHDLRRTAASGMAALGVALPVIEKVLNHQSGSFAGVVGVYQRHGYRTEKAEALQTWAEHVGALVSPDAGDSGNASSPGGLDGSAGENVIPIRVRSP